MRTAYLLTIHGHITEQPVTAVEADDIIAGAVAWDDEMTVTYSGSITILDDSKKTVLEPQAKPYRISPGEYEDLKVIGERAGSGSPVYLELHPDRGTLHIASGFWRAPASVTERLIRRGWVAVAAIGEGYPVAVSVAGRIAMASHEKRRHLPRDREVAMLAAARDGLDAHPIPS